MDLYSTQKAMVEQVLYRTSMKEVNFFSAINDACLVYDGRLVIDAAFHTNDVSIRGAGPLSKYQRSYHADQWSHANFNSKEVGIQVRLFDDDSRQNMF